MIWAIISLSLLCLVLFSVLCGLAYAHIQKSTLASAYLEWITNWEKKYQLAQEYMHKKYGEHLPHTIDRLEFNIERLKLETEFNEDQSSDL